MHLTLVYSSNVNGELKLSIITVPAPKEGEMRGTETEEGWFERTHPVLARPVTNYLFVGLVYNDLSPTIGSRVTSLTIDGETPPHLPTSQLST